MKPDARIISSLCVLVGGESSQVSGDIEPMAERLNWCIENAGLRNMLVVLNVICLAHAEGSGFDRTNDGKEWLEVQNELRRILDRTNDPPRRVRGLHSAMSKRLQARENDVSVIGTNSLE